MFHYLILCNGNYVTSTTDPDRVGKREVGLCYFKLSTTEVKRTPDYEGALALLGLESPPEVRVGDTIEVRISTFVPEVDQRQERVTEDQEELYCSFCGKSQHDVKKLIAGPSVFICDECIDLCCDILQVESRREDKTRH